MSSQRTRYHPLSDLAPEEIEASTQIIKAAYPPDATFDFRSSSLYEPERKDMVDFLRREHGGEPQEGISPRPPREARVVYYLKSTQRLFESIVDLFNQRLVSNVMLEAGVYANMNAQEMERAAAACVNHPLVRKEAERLGLKSGTVLVCEPWMYGSAGDEADNDRKFQCYMYMRDPENPQNAAGNFYAFPLDFSPVMDANTFEILRILYLPTTAASWDSTPKQQYASHGPNEYIPELNTLRQDLKPLHISQPEGVSFTVTDGNLVQWQKWRFRVGFNFREGLVLHDVHIDGRSAFHRLALSEMVVPYADPRPPFHRKSAFDFGDAGAGITANSLALGCDCLGVIKYFHGHLVTEDGGAVTNRNVVCMHEIDDLLSWKHTLPNGRADSARNRNLVLQTISTLANYEYIFMWIFDVAGGITLEIRATGIVSTQPLEAGITDYPYGTIVHPGVGAPSHQHIFCMRIDPAVDGFNNQVVQTDSVPMPLSDENKYGVGFLAENTILSKAGAYDSDLSRARVWKVQNPSVNNPITKKPVAWKLHPHNSQMLLAHKDSYHWKRAGFADHALFLTKYKRDEIYASGNFTNQSQQDTGVRGWSDRNEEIEDDLVLWHSFGMTHIPRVEDFPVMPIAKLHVKLEPYNFFERNPAIDVPPSTLKDLKSYGVPDVGTLKL